MERRRFLPSFLLTLAVGCVVGGRGGTADEAGDHRARLLTGVRRIAAPGVPGSVAAYGERSFVVVAGREGRSGQAPFGVASFLGKGRIVAFGHDGIFGRDALQVGETGRFLENAVRWAAGDAAAPRVGVVRLPDLRDHLKGAGLPVLELEAGALPGQAEVLVVTHGALTPASIPVIRRFVEAGGGVVAASTGWGWAQITRKPIREHPGTQLAAGAGLAWTPGTLERTSPEGFDTTAPVSALVHSGAAMEALLSRKALGVEETAQAVSSGLLAVRCAPENDPLLAAQVRKLRAAAGNALIPTEKRPVSLRDGLGRLALALDVERGLQGPFAKGEAHPAAADFPGAVPAGAPRVTRRVRIDLSVPGWHSTGLYAAAGDGVSIRIPAEAARRGLSVRIGCHSDELWHLAAWKRVPALTRTTPLTGEVTEVGSAFGGMLYVVVPERGGTGEIEVTLEGAVEAPYFRLGKTDPAEWRRTVRQHPAPWAELAGERVIFTVPSSLIRTLEHPDSLMRLWDRAVSAQEALVGRTDRRRPERIVADRQISAGYMHSGYPIMVPIDDSAVLAMDERRLRAEGSWGHFHELGHNLQSPDWTFDGTGEVTNNILAMHVYPEVLGLRFDGGHPAIRDRNARTERVRKYFAAGSRFEDWKKDPFLALAMYIQLIDGFGWTPFREVFHEYRSLPRGERPRTDAEKRDQWLVRFSRRVGRNLGPFFQAWGVPTSAEVRASVAALPPWMPPDLPAQ